MEPMHPRIKIWMELAGLLAEAAEAGAKELAKEVEKKLKPKRRGNFLTRRPGADTPLWNACSLLLSAELKKRGSRVHLARYLGVPKQRVTDYFRGHRRMPDAETLLQMIEWLAHKRAGVDLSVSSLDGAKPALPQSAVGKAAGPAGKVTQ
ncbi:MAG: hypothetical protein RL376_632 [Verrucomicrobiota bacterium]